MSFSFCLVTIYFFFNMIDIKMNLTLLVPSATIMSEQECSKQLKKPVIIKRGKYAGKQARDKEGNLLWYHESVPDLDKYDKQELTLSLPNNQKQTIVYYTRKKRDARQVMNLSTDAYNYFISNETPVGYRAPKNFKPYASIRTFKHRKTKEVIEGTSINAQSWRILTPKERIEWHLNAIAESLGGKVESYTIFKD